jgi:hypothetical protein
MGRANMILPHIILLLRRFPNLTECEVGPLRSGNRHGGPGQVRRLQ